LVESTVAPDLFKRRIAQVLSILGHPFVCVPVVSLFVGWNILTPSEAATGVLTVVAACLVPISIYICGKVRTGEFSDLDVSQRKDRPHLFTVGILLLTVTCVILYLTHQPPAFVRGCSAAILLICSGWTLNFWIKPSMHAGFAMLTSVSLWPLGVKIAFPMTIFAILVGWSRVILSRHTKLEVGVGLILGAIVARIFFT
jgi:membrane-associated phospholipid phosphatase